MFEKKFNYTDYLGNKREETHYFNLSQAELVEMQVSEEGGLQKVIERVTETQDNKKIVEIFKNLILKSYGEPSLDGRQFVKVRPDKTRPADEFAQTEMYNQLFMELATNAAAAAAFVNGVASKVETSNATEAAVEVVK